MRWLKALGIQKAIQKDQAAASKLARTLQSLCTLLSIFYLILANVVG